MQRTLSVELAFSNKKTTIEGSLLIFIFYLRKVPKMKTAKTTI